MGQLRDFFAAIGFCESTEDLARKPELIDRVVEQSLRYADTQRHYEQDSTYEERLRQLLPNASSYSLDRLIEENVIVCLDQRLSRQNTGFWSTSIRAIFYNGDEQKVLSLRDNGMLNPGFFDSDNLSYCSSIFNKTAEYILDRNNQSPVIAGYIAGSKSKYFTWDSGRGFKYEFERNPELREPPLTNESRNAPLDYPDHPIVKKEIGPLGPY